MITCERTNSENEDFKGLVRELDKELAIIDGKDHTFYSQYNAIDAIKHVVIAYDGDIAVGCGALKQYSGEITALYKEWLPGYPELWAICRG